MTRARSAKRIDGFMEVWVTQKPRDGCYRTWERLVCDLRRTKSLRGILTACLLTGDCKRLFASPLDYTFAGLLV
jgi:hypothetical protein